MPGQDELPDTSKINEAAHAAMGKRRWDPMAALARAEAGPQDAPEASQAVSKKRKRSQDSDVDAPLIDLTTGNKDNPIVVDNLPPRPQAAKRQRKATVAQSVPVAVEAPPPPPAAPANLLEVQEAAMREAQASDPSYVGPKAQSMREKKGKKAEAQRAFRERKRSQRELARTWSKTVVQVQTAMKMVDERKAHALRAAAETAAAEESVEGEEEDDEAEDVARQAMLYAQDPREESVEGMKGDDGFEAQLQAMFDEPAQQDEERLLLQGDAEAGDDASHEVVSDDGDDEDERERMAALFEEDDEADVDTSYDVDVEDDGLLHEMDPDEYIAYYKLR